MSLLHKKALRRLILSTLADVRPHLKDKMTRVSGKFLVRAEAQLRGWVRNQIEVMPSTGKTIR